MPIMTTLTMGARKVAAEASRSLRRARLEGERRVLQRQHRAALEELGERVHQLVREGGLDDRPIAPEVAAVDARLAEIEGKAAAIERLRDEGEAEGGDASGNPPDEDAPSRVDPAWAQAERHFRS